MTSGFRLVASSALHKGDREYQQDQLALLSHPRAQGCVLAIVADGMGGRSGGRKASDQVILTARQLFERYSPQHDDAQAFLKKLVDEAHMVIQLTAISSEQEPHSTLAAFLLNPGGECHWVHAGDSRIYHFHGSRLVRKTKDHSFVQTLVDAGQLTEEQANNHPKSNILMSCLGTEETPPYDLNYIADMRPGDILLACSDGVWHYFTPVELGAILNRLSPREAAEQLISQARTRAAGGGDNLSLIIVKFEHLESETGLPPLP
jgi:PPM family protein phosphatase